MNAWMLLERDWTVADVSPDAPAELQLAVGHSLWDDFPASADAFRGVYENAWTLGAANELIYWNDMMVDVAAIVQRNRLLVRLASVTLNGLFAALDHLEARLDAGWPVRDGGLHAPPRRPTERHLRIL